MASASVRIDLTPFRRLRRSMEFATDMLRLAGDAHVREFRREWDPDLQRLLLDDVEKTAIVARAFGRTLEEIDELQAGRNSE